MKGYSPRGNKPAARRWVVLAALLCAACAGGDHLRPGVSSIEDLHLAMGEPALRWQDADGSLRYAYPRGPAGFTTIMVKIDAGGTVRAVENVLDEAHFAAIAPGMEKEQVLRLLGPPQPHWTVYFAARDELAWEWRYCDAWNAAARFAVLFDATRGTVRSTISVRENCMFGDCPCSR